MKASGLYARLEEDFVDPAFSDDWYEYMDSGVRSFVCENFAKRSIGLVCDFADEVSSVFCATFPSDSALEYVLDSGVSDALVFSHHAADWDIRKDPVFTQMNPQLLARLRERRISVYVLHTPLDAPSEFSTSTTLAQALGCAVVGEPFGSYNGALVGVVGETQVGSARALQEHAAGVVGHAASLYAYGADEIAGGLVGFVGGGGTDAQFFRDAAALGLNTYVTGITALSEYSAKAHGVAKELGVNLIGLSHYSSEKFALLRMVEYFEELGLSAEFIPEEPVLADL